MDESDQATQDLILSLIAQDLSAEAQLQHNDLDSENSYASGEEEEGEEVDEEGAEGEEDEEEDEDHEDEALEDATVANGGPASNHESTRTSQHTEGEPESTFTAALAENQSQWDSPYNGSYASGEHEEEPLDDVTDADSGPGWNAELGPSTQTFAIDVMSDEDDWPYDPSTDWGHDTPRKKHRRPSAAHQHTQDTNKTPGEASNSVDVPISSRAGPLTQVKGESTSPDKASAKHPEAVCSSSHTPEPPFEWNQPPSQQSSAHSSRSHSPCLSDASYDIAGAMDSNQEELAENMDWTSDRPPGASPVPESSTTRSGLVPQRRPFEDIAPSSPQTSTEHKRPRQVDSGIARSGGQLAHRPAADEQETRGPQDRSRASAQQTTGLTPRRRLTSTRSGRHLPTTYHTQIPQDPDPSSSYLDSVTEYANIVGRLPPLVRSSDLPPTIRAQSGAPHAKQGNQAAATRSESQISAQVRERRNALTIDRPADPKPPPSRRRMPQPDDFGYDYDSPSAGDDLDGFDPITGRRYDTEMHEGIEHTVINIPWSGQPAWVERDVDESYDGDLSIRGRGGRFISHAERREQEARRRKEATAVDIMIGENETCDSIVMDIINKENREKKGKGKGRAA